MSTDTPDANDLWGPWTVNKENLRPEGVDDNDWVQVETVGGQLFFRPVLVKHVNWADTTTSGVYKYRILSISAIS